MKKLIILLTLFGYCLSFGNDYEISSKKTIIKVTAQESKSIHLNIVEPLEKFVIVFVYEYWGEICDQYTRSNDPNDEYSRKQICVKYRRGMVQSRKRLTVVNRNADLTELTIIAEQRGHDLNLYLNNNESSDKRLKKNLFGNFKIKI